MERGNVIQIKGGNRKTVVVGRRREKGHRVIQMTGQEMIAFN
jgi:hypothetical protein